MKNKAGSKSSKVKQLTNAFQQKQKERGREIEEQQNQEKQKRALLEQQAREAAEAAEAQRRKELEKKLNPVRQRTLSTVKKSTAKAAGLKSTFILSPNELLMTAFGKGNEAIIEKKISRGIVENVAEKPAFTAVPEEDKAFRIDGRVKNAQTDNPLHTADAAPRQPDDLIHAKAALEQRYFGQTFDSNLHIQMIYNILDIEKILAIHVNNIVYTLNNFLRQEGEDVDDFIGYITLNDNTYQQFMEKKGNTADELRALFARLCSARQLGYLNLEVVIPPKAEIQKKKKQDPNTIKLTEEEFFNVLYALGTMRLMLAHGDPYKNIYTLDGYGKNNAIINVLERLYLERITELNNNFLKTAAKNLALLFKAFGIQDVKEKEKLVQDYYDFTVRKQYKNLGFSIKLLREHMTADIEEAFVLRDKAYDSVRGKLYPFIDFAIFQYYKIRESERDELVNGLRASFNELEKDALYNREAVRIWPKVRNVILNHILPEMSGQVIKETMPDSDVTDMMLSGVKIGTSAFDFSKFIYLVTLFINGKEINDLLTTLIHKFENIAAFLSVIQAEKLPAEFVPAFQVFAESQKIAEELRIINSFARMSKPSSKAKKIMYIEAFKVLGMNGNDERLEQEADSILDPQNKGGSQLRGLRNFIANNVIESERFKYLVRYGNVNKLKGIAANRTVVSFVLKDVPDAQIARYYNSVTGEDKDFIPAMRDYLADRLTGFSFEDISDVRQNDQFANQKEQEEKRQKQALVRLYLTVLYLTLKNLVYVNSRYFLAFHCVERDRLLLYPEKWEKVKDKFSADYGFSIFARDFLSAHPQKKRVATYLEQNFANSDEWALRAFRNKAEHLDAVRNADLYLNDIREFHSWFELYHYIMQRRIQDQFSWDSIHNKRGTSEKIITKEELNPKLLEYFSLVSRYRVYCKDFVKALCVPFAYNLPRYKNLSIDALFDMNRPGREEKEEP